VIDEFDYFAEALQLANSSEFGLSSAIFTKDLAKALEFIRRSESGLVHVNRETANVEPHVPFGGMKGSSNLAREQGRAARGFFTKTKTAYIRSIS
jgi:aldehyde dehydrogenase (NAD+)